MPLELISLLKYNYKYSEGSEEIKFHNFETFVDRSSIHTSQSYYIMDSNIVCKLECLWTGFQVITNITSTYDDKIKTSSFISAPLHICSLHICPSAYLPLCIFALLHICPSAYLPLCVSTPLCLLLILKAPSFCFSVHLLLSVCLSINHRATHLQICPFVGYKLVAVHRCPMLVWCRGVGELEKDSLK